MDEMVAIPIIARSKVARRRRWKSYQAFGGM